MPQRFRFVASVILLIIPLTLYAQDIWQGNAAIALRGELPQDGYYAASNAFPYGTKLLVTNLENNKSLTVTVLRRLNGVGNIFILLSPKAAAELGLKGQEVARIKTLVVGISSDLTTNPEAYAYKAEESTSPQLSPTPTPTPTPTYTPTPSFTPSPIITPSPIPSPTPTPLVTQEEIAKSDFSKDRFTTPFTGPQPDISSRQDLQAEKDRLGEVELKEARVSLKEKAEAVILSRPTPEKADEVIAILIEPKENLKKSEAEFSSINRPNLEREAVEAALQEPILMALEKPFIYERHGLAEESEEIALANLDIPNVMATEKASVDSYIKSFQEEDRLTLETHVLPELAEKEKAEVLAIAKSEAEQEKIPLKDFNLPDIVEKEKAEVLALNKTEVDQDKIPLKTFNLPEIVEKEKAEITTKEDVAGKDKVTTDLALIPTDPRPPQKTEKSETKPETTTTSKTITTTTEPEKQVILLEGQEFLRHFYYLQIGVYKERQTAERIVAANPSYPMMIIPATLKGQQVYKLVVGPLKRDESGTILYLFRARGYKDAFIRYIE